MRDQRTEFAISKKIPRNGLGLQISSTLKRRQLLMDLLLMT